MNPASLRADAVGNRARIIAAARAAIGCAGKVKLNAIARQAGVGQGPSTATSRPARPCSPRSTGGRRRTRGGGTGAPRQARAAHRAGLLARPASRLRAGQAGVFGAVAAAVSQDLAAHSLGPIGEAVILLLDAGKTDGTIRPDVDARDVILLVGYLTRLEEDGWDARARHLLHVVLDGLRRVQLVYGGTNEIMKTIIARDLTGLRA